MTLIKLAHQMDFYHLSMLSYLLRLECQNKFRIDTQIRLASGNPPLRDIASNNKGRVDNRVML